MGGDPEGMSDQMWRPGYRGPAPQSVPIRLPDTSESGAARGKAPGRHDQGPTGVSTPSAARDELDVPDLFEQHAVSAHAEVPAPHRSRRIVAFVAVAVAVAVVASIVLADAAEDLAERADELAAATSAPTVPSDELPAARPTSRSALPDVVATLPDVVAVTGVPFAGADPDRLPDTLNVLWSREFSADAVDDVWVEVIDRRSALVATGAGGNSRAATSVLRSIDVDSGLDQWSIDVAAPPRSVSLVATNDDTIALLVDGQLTGVDSTNGEQTWRHVRARPVFAPQVDRLAGTDLLAIGAADDTSTLIDISSGERVGRLDGPTIDTDHLGRWFVRRGSEVIVYDLRDGFEEPTVIVNGADAPVVAVIDQQVLASSAEGWNVTGVSNAAASTEREVVEGSDVLPTAAAIRSMLGTTFVVAGAGSIVGADLDGRAVLPAWERSGALTAMYPTERGLPRPRSERRRGSPDDLRRTHR